MAVYSQPSVAAAKMLRPVWCRSMCKFIQGTSLCLKEYSSKLTSADPQCFAGNINYKELLADDAMVPISSPLTPQLGDGEEIDKKGDVVKRLKVQAIKKISNRAQRR
nr:uncharacterized protein LOC117858555 [Setaria viridis]